MIYFNESPIEKGSFFYYSDDDDDDDYNVTSGGSRGFRFFPPLSFLFSLSSSWLGCCRRNEGTRAAAHVLTLIN